MTIFVFSAFILPIEVFAASCGNGSCQSSQGENCSTCPADCGCSTGYYCSPANTCDLVTPPPTPTGSGSPTPTPSSSSTPAPSGGQSSSSSGKTANYTPSIVLSKHPSDYTNSQSLTFSGVAFTEQGEIVSVEYLVDGKTGWVLANSSDGTFNQGSETFSFTTPVLPEGRTTVRIRTKTSLGYTSEITKTTTIIVTPPEVELDKITPNPTSDTSPTISGLATSKSGSIASVQISFDGGQTWIGVGSAGRFLYTSQPMEDGNYQVVARATDSGGNSTTSDAQTLVIDTIPPIIGGAIMSSGSQILLPDVNGDIDLLANIKTSIAIGMKGGVTKAKIVSNDTSFDLASGGTHLWTGVISFPTYGSRKLIVYAEDGAGNKTQRSFGSYTVEPNGEVTFDGANPIKNAKVEVYSYDEATKSWFLWDAKAYGQTNPQVVEADGKYSFLVPPGKYHLVVSADGYYAKESSIVNASESMSLNTQITLKKRPGIFLNLPRFGKIFLGLPYISFENFDIKPVFLHGTSSELVGQKSPQISVSNLEGKNINIPPLGKKNLLIFLSGWSQSSLLEAGVLNDMNLPEGETLQVVALQESIVETKSIVERGGYKFPVFSDNFGESASVFNVTNLPYNVFIDSKGIVRFVVPGIMSKDKILAKFQELN